MNTDPLDLHHPDTGPGSHDPGEGHEPDQHASEGDLLAGFLPPALDQVFHDLTDAFAVLSGLGQVGQEHAPATPDGEAWSEPPAHFDPYHPPAGLIGHPAEDIFHWHQQEHSDTCAIVSQEFVLDQLTGQHIPEEQLRQEAMSHGWYTPGGGTPLDHVGDLLELHGVPVEREYGASLQDIANHLDAGEKVLVAVNAEEIWYPDHSALSLAPLLNYLGIPGQPANHAVEVIGIDRSDPAHPQVILNDPGTADGRGLMVSADTFAHAHASSGGFAVFTAAHAPPVVPHFGGYYKADGTYHSSSDNTDRDPHTGAIIRRW